VPETTKEVTVTKQAEQSKPAAGEAPKPQPPSTGC